MKGTSRSIAILSLFLLFYGYELFAKDADKDKVRDPFTLSDALLALGIEEDLASITGVQTRSIASIQRATIRELELKGIWIGEKGRTAFINDAVVGIGDAVDGFVVKRIEKSSVILESGEQEFKLNLVTTSKSEETKEPEEDEETGNGNVPKPLPLQSEEKS